MGAVGYCDNGLPVARGSLFVTVKRALPHLVLLIIHS